MSETYLVHHGIKGQKWGVRRFQNEDGSLTPAGKSRYYNSDGSLTRAGKKRQAMRDDYVKRNTERIEKIQYEQQQAKRTLSDLKKNGTHGSAFKDEYGNYSDQDFEERYTMSKKEALDYSIREARSELDKANMNVKDIAAIKKDMAKVMNASLDEDTFVEASNRGANVAAGMLAAGSIGGTAVYALTGGSTEGMLAMIGMSILGSVASGAYLGIVNKKNVEKYGMSGKT